MEIVHLTHPMRQINIEPHVMAMGFFDGVHLGHQQLLRQAKKIAKENNIAFTAMTFSPHPDEVIKGQKDRKYLTPLSAKTKKMAEFGVEKLFVMTFNRAFASLLPADFVNDYILGLYAQHVVVGFDFTFGFKALGDTDYLKKFSEDNLFDVTVVPKKTYNNEKISSTLLREMISDGDVHLVPYYSGTHYQVSFAKVQQVNSKTMKVRIEDKYLLPKPGHYNIEVSDGSKTCLGAFHHFSSSQKDDEILMTGLIDWSSQDLSMTFLNRISSAHPVSVLI